MPARSKKQMLKSRSKQAKKMDIESRFSRASDRAGNRLRMDDVKRGRSVGAIESEANFKFNRETARRRKAATRRTMGPPAKIRKPSKRK